MSDSARHNLFLLAESTYGTTPSSDPEFVDIRHTGTTLALTKEGTISEELHSDRQIRDSRHGVKAVGGDINFELSYGSFDTLLEAVLLGTWSTNVLKAGVTRRSFSMLRHFTDQASGDKPYHLFSGIELNTLNLNIPVTGLVTGSFGTLGKGLTLLGDLSTLGTPTFTDPTTTAPFDGFTGSITEGGTATSVVTAIDLTLANGLAPIYHIGSDETSLPSIGRCTLNGSITAVFQNAALFDKFVNETESALVVTLEDPAGNTYEINLPRIKYNGGQPDVSGEGSIVLTLPIQALYKVSDLSNIVITRANAS